MSFVVFYQNDLMTLVKASDIPILNKTSIHCMLLVFCSVSYISNFWCEVIIQFVLSNTLGMAKHCNPDSKNEIEELNKIVSGQISFCLHYRRNFIVCICAV